MDNTVVVVLSWRLSPAIMFKDAPTQSTRSYVSLGGPPAILYRSRTKGGNMRRFALVLGVIVYATLVLGSAACAISVSFERYWPNQAYFAEPSGIAVDSSGNIYVADTKNHRIVKLDSSGNVVATFGQKGTGSGTVNDDKLFYPYGVHVGYDGYLYVADTGNSRIKKMTTSFTMVTTWGGYGILTNGKFDWPLSCCTDSSGYVYVTDSGQYRGTPPQFGGNRIQKFNSDGSFVQAWGNFSETATNNGYALPSSITWCSTLNRLFITDTMHNRVGVVEVNGTWYSSFTGPSDLSFHAPRGICYIPTPSSQYFAVADTNRDRVCKVFASGAKYWSKGSGQSSQEGMFYFPRAVAADTSGNVYVADTFNQRVQKLDPSGNFLARYGGRGTLDGAFDRPNAICTDSSGNVYVADTYNSRVQKFDANGGFLLKFGTKGTSDADMNWPQGIDVDGSGNIYIADSENNRIKKFNSAGNFVAKFSTINKPTGVAVDSSGNVYAADQKNHRVVKYNSAGTVLLVIGQKGHQPGEFEDPTDVDLDTSGNIYVCDSGNHRIQKFSANGSLIWSYGGFGTGNRQFHFPKGICVQPDGSVYVADTENQRVQLLNSSGTYVTKWGSWGTDQGQLKQPADVAVGANGAVYVIERSNYRVSKFAVTP